MILQRAVSLSLSPEKSIPKTHLNSEYYTHYSPPAATEAKTGVSAKPLSWTLPPSTHTPKRRKWRIIGQHCSWVANVLTALWFHTHTSRDGSTPITTLHSSTSAQRGYGVCCLAKIKFWFFNLYAKTCLMSIISDFSFASSGSLSHLNS